MKKISCTFNTILILSMSILTGTPSQASELTLAEKMDALFLQPKRKSHIPFVKLEDNASLDNIAEAFDQYFQNFRAYPEIPFTDKELEQEELDNQTFFKALDYAHTTVQKITEDAGWTQEMDARYNTAVVQFRVVMMPGANPAQYLSQVTPASLLSYYYNPCNENEAKAIRPGSAQEKYEDFARDFCDKRLNPSLDFRNQKVSIHQIFSLLEHDFLDGTHNLQLIFNKHAKLVGHGNATPFIKNLEKEVQCFAKTQQIIRQAINYFWHREKILTYNVFSHPKNLLPDTSKKFLAMWICDPGTSSSFWYDQLKKLVYATMDAGLKTAFLNGWSPFKIATIKNMHPASIALLQYVLNQQTLRDIFIPTSPLPPQTAEELIAAYVKWLDPLETDNLPPSFSASCLGKWADYSLSEHQRSQITQGIFDYHDLDLEKRLMEMLVHYHPYIAGKIRKQSTFLKQWYQSHPDVKRKAESFIKSMLPDSQTIKSETLEAPDNVVRGDACWWQLEKGLNLLNHIFNTLTHHPDMQRVAEFKKDLFNENDEKTVVIKMADKSFNYAVYANNYLRLLKNSYVKPYNAWQSSILAGREGDTTYKPYQEAIQKLSPGVISVALEAMNHALTFYDLLNTLRSSQSTP